jgi:hypothetical protein
MFTSECVIYYWGHRTCISQVKRPHISKQLQEAGARSQIGSAWLRLRYSRVKQLMYIGELAS